MNAPARNEGQPAKVQRLPSIVVDQIAAGEVVERPANIVKELVENALDAGARRVSVDVEEGGVALVRVSDDGHGMSPEDASLALERHATSKLRAFEDLGNLASFGFRGEALPSIASVSRFKLWTRTKNTPQGTVVTAIGELRSVEPAGAAVGTTVEVRDLFFNVPARRKFLKSTATEAAHVADVVLSMALCRPDVTFVLTRDGRVQRELLACAGDDERAARAARVAQAFPKAELREVSGAQGGIAFDAWLSPASEARAGASGLYLVVNGRAVRDPRLARAVANAYGDALESGRFPAGVVYVDMPPQDVDVNAHPQKTEVRFRDARSLFDVFATEIGRAYSPRNASAGLSPQAPWASQPRMTTTWTAPEPPAPHTPMAPSFDAGMLFASPSIASASAGPATPAAAEAVAGSASRPASGTSFFAGLRPVAMVRGELCVCESGDGIYVIDCHAAFERVAFQVLSRGGSVQAPQASPSRRTDVGEPQVHIEPSVADVLERHAEALRARGFVVERTGARHVMLLDAPAALLGTPSSEIMDIIAREVSSSASEIAVDAWHRINASLACAAATRITRDVTLERVREVLSGLSLVTFTGRCLHDRPVVSRMGFDEIDRRLGC